jgi:hypothetical protein
MVRIRASLAEEEISKTSDTNDIKPLQRKEIMMNLNKGPLEEIKINQGIEQKFLLSAGMFEVSLSDLLGESKGTIDQRIIQE